MLSGEFQKGMNKMPYYYYWDWTYLLIIPGLILGLIAQAKVKSACLLYTSPSPRD